MLIPLAIHLNIQRPWCNCVSSTCLLTKLESKSAHWPDTQIGQQCPFLSTDLLHDNIGQVCEKQVIWPSRQAQLWHASTRQVSPLAYRRPDSTERHGRSEDLNGCRALCGKNPVSSAHTHTAGVTHRHHERVSYESLRYNNSNRLSSKASRFDLTPPHPVWEIWLHLTVSATGWDDISQTGMLDRNTKIIFSCQRLIDGLSKV